MDLYGFVMIYDEFGDKSMVSRCFKGIYRTTVQFIR